MSSDGGFLETTVTGVTNLAQGSLVYGDASEIVTELPVASNSDVLTLTAGLPSWATPAASTWTTLADVVLGGAGTLTSGIFSNYNLLYISIHAALNAVGGQSIIFNSDNGVGQYPTTSIRNNILFNTSQQCIQYGYGATTNWIHSTCFVNQTTTGEKLAILNSTERTGSGASDYPNICSLSSMWRNTVDDIDEVTIGNDGGTAVDCQTLSRMVVLGAS